MLQSILIANRGEIAVRIINTCRVLGVRTVAAYSDADTDAFFVRLADEAHHLGPAPAGESYLSIPRLLAVAEAAGVDAVHPGYGLLSESADFATAVIDRGLVFIGPPPEVIATMGDKIAARRIAQHCGVPLLPGSEGVVDDPRAALELADDIGFPVLVKACFGGGGRGMRVIHHPHALEQALTEAARESRAAFGRSEIYLERYISHARHVEVQVLGDLEGNVIHVGDRDCSVQRRHQKLIEEAPAPGLSDAFRAELCDAAVRLAREVSYPGAGTVEFLVDMAAGRFYFLEMNTRLQVEHGVTELISGLDLVEWQIRVASGQPLAITQEQVALRGHAIQARIGAEDPWHDFRPHPGTISRLLLPQGPWLRMDFGVESGDSIPGFYDAMFGKVLAWGDSRETARRRLGNALDDLRVNGLATTAPYLRQVLEQPQFVSSRHDTGSVERDWQPEGEGFAPPPAQKPAEVPEVTPVGERRVSLNTLHGGIELAIFGRGRNRGGEVEQRGIQGGASSRHAMEPLAPMDANVIDIPVKVGDRVEKGTVVAVLEAMKMELQVRAPRAAAVEAILAEVGKVAKKDSVLVKLSADTS